MLFLFFFFKQKTAYEMRISDWSSDVCSSDLLDAAEIRHLYKQRHEIIRFQRLVGMMKEVAGRLTTDDDLPNIDTAVRPFRSEERRVGKECVSTCRSRWSPDH